MAAHGVESIGVEEFARLRADMPDIPETALIRVLRLTDVPLAPMIEGVRQDSFDNLARTLIALQHEYEAGDAAHRHRVRSMVITAKDHARLAARRKPEKAEMVDWLLVWLENPIVFENWWRLRVSAGTPGNTDTPADPGCE